MAERSQRLRELMREYQSGRFEAFDEIYASIAPALRRYLLSQARDAAKADDLVQETFLQMHRARHTYDPSFPLMPWAMAIARHVWLMDRRTLSRRPWAPDDVTEMELPVRAEAASFADRRDVRRALGKVAASRATPSFSITCSGSASRRSPNGPASPRPRRSCDRAAAWRSCARC